MNISSYLKSRAKLVDSALNKYLPKESMYPFEVHKSMRYSVFAGGKRIRPILAILAAETLGSEPKKVLPIACAFELIHTYSLIHDDLPCMDDDDLRRGKPTNHKVFGEAVAVLAGDALLTFAFELAARNAYEKGIKPVNAVKALELLAQASGTAGMIGGQIVDILSENKEPTLPVLQYIHTHKTGALIRAPLLASAILLGAKKKEFEALRKYGGYLGLIFQIVDDILNVTGDAKKLGKSVGSDEARKKMTYPALFGLEESKRQVAELSGKAKEAVRIFGKKADSLKSLVDFVIERES
ncbi:MAG: polyprenyl synthetase family protein [Candidatus Firestonebacteria bacterium]